MLEFVAGLGSMGFAVAGLFFLRFWRRTHDVLFIYFAAAFWLFAINQAVAALLQIGAGSGLEYLLRLLGFVLIIFAIISKNVGSAGEVD